MRKNLSMESLSQATLVEASVLADALFPDDIVLPSLAFRASVFPGEYRDFWKRFSLTSLQYWVGVFDGHVVGTTGLYSTDGDNGVLWLGFFCVHPDYRRQGVGTTLLRFSSERARKRGAHTLRLYSDLHTLSKGAGALYLREGFSDAGKGMIEGKQVVFLEKSL